MMQKHIYEELKSIKENLNIEKYPESFELIDDSIDDDGNVYVTPFDIACDLHEADKSEVMPKCIANFVIEVYLGEIEKENAEAMTNLGSLYYTGRCGERSYEKAIKYYLMTDEHGERQATENLCYCYYYGRSVPINYEKAFHYFVKGALDGHLNSLYKVGDMYKNGYYVKKDEKEAFYIYRRCYEQMTEKCIDLIGADICMRMGNVYYYGIGTPKNLELALKYYQQAEQYFYVKLKNGNCFSKKGLKEAIVKQSAIRTELSKLLPDFDWCKIYD